MSHVTGTRESRDENRTNGGTGNGTYDRCSTMNRQTSLSSDTSQSACPSMESGEPNCFAHTAMTNQQLNTCNALMPGKPMVCSPNTGHVPSNRSTFHYNQENGNVSPSEEAFLHTVVTNCENADESEICHSNIGHHLTLNQTTLANNINTAINHPNKSPMSNGVGKTFLFEDDIVNNTDCGRSDTDSETALLYEEKSVHTPDTACSSSEKSSVSNALEEGMSLLFEKELEHDPCSGHSGSHLSAKGPNVGYVTAPVNEDTVNGFNLDSDTSVINRNIESRLPLLCKHVEMCISDNESCDKSKSSATAGNKETKLGCKHDVKFVSCTECCDKQKASGMDQKIVSYTPRVCKHAVKHISNTICRYKSDIATHYPKTETENETTPLFGNLTVCNLHLKCNSCHNSDIFHRSESCPDISSDRTTVYTCNTACENPVIVRVINEVRDDNGAVNGTEEDALTSMVDLEKINSIKSKRSSSKRSGRKESFEQRLRRTFTIQDEHTSEVTKRIVAIVIKYSLFVFNFLSWVMATGAIGTGIWMLTDTTIVVSSNTDIFLDPPKLTVIGGSITFIVALLGCVGALRENLVLLRVFFYVLIVILLGEMTLGVAVFVIYTVPEARENFLRSQPEKLLRMAIERYMDDEEIKTWVDMTQSKFKCCGISHTEEGFRDWSISPYFNCTPSNKSIYRCAVPMSCCIFEKGDRVNTMCGFDMTDKPVIEVKDYIYVRGCIEGFGEWLAKYDGLIIIACLSILIMQFLAVLSAKLMVIRISKNKTRWKVLHRRHSSSSNAATIPTSE